MADLFPQFEETAAQTEFRKQYMAALAKLYEVADFTGLMDLSEDVPVALKRIYVPLKFTKEDLDDKTPKEIDEAEKTEIIELFNTNPFWVILGGPGSGKTTLVRHLAWSLSDPDTTGLAVSIGKRIVIPFILRDYPFNQIDSAEGLLRKFCDKSTRVFKWDKIGRALNPEDLLFFARNGWVLFAFDGLDEMQEINDRENLRDWIYRYFAPLHKDNWIVCTSRPVGYERCPIESWQPKKEGKSAAVSLPLLRRVSPFDEKQLVEFSRRWHGLRISDPMEADIAARKFKEALANHKGLDELKRRPVFVTLMAHVHQTIQELPFSRIKLYEEIVRAYVQILDKHKKVASRRNSENEKLGNHERRPDKHEEGASWWNSENDKHRILEQLGYEFHCMGQNRLGRSGAQLDKEETVLLIKRIIEENEGAWESVHCGNEKDLLEYFLSRTGLLIEPVEGAVQFMHLSIQEYLAARHLNQRYAQNFNPPDFVKEHLEPRVNEPFWRETVLLFLNMRVQAAFNPGIAVQILGCFKDPAKYPAEIALSFLDNPYQKLADKDVTALLNAALLAMVNRNTEERRNLFCRLYERHGPLIIRTMEPLVQQNQADVTEVIGVVTAYLPKDVRRTDMFARLADSITQGDPERLLPLRDLFAADSPACGAALLEKYPISAFTSPLTESVWVDSICESTGVNAAVKHLGMLEMIWFFISADPLDLDLVLDLAKDLYMDLHKDSSRPPVRCLDRDQARDRARELARALNRTMAIDRYPITRTMVMDMIWNANRVLDLVVTLAKKLNHELALVLTQAMDRARAVIQIRVRDWDRGGSLKPDLVRSLLIFAAFNWLHRKYPPPREGIRQWIEEQVRLLNAPFDDFWRTIAVPDDAESLKLKQAFYARFEKDRQDRNFIAHRLEQCLKKGFDERMFDPDYFFEWFHGQIKVFIQKAK